MNINKRMFLLVFFLLSACAGTEKERYQTIIDEVTAKKVDSIVRSELIPLSGEKHGEIISRISLSFLGTPYQENTLIGDSDTTEALVVNFNSVDCFTFIDYVEALARSHDQKSFINILARVRYIGGAVDYYSRRHFFSDWFASAPYNGRDVTPFLSPDYKVADKQLNKKPGGGEYINGLGIHDRKINYIPGSSISQKILNGLKTGDYVGVYSALEGLDVSHVGIVIRHDGKVWFRNASSLAMNRKVVDVPFLEYMRTKPGIIVIRSELPDYSASFR